MSDITSTRQAGVLRLDTSDTHVSARHVRQAGKGCLLTAVLWCRPLSKTVRFNVLRVQHAGPASKVKKGFTNF